MGNNKEKNGGHGLGLAIVAATAAAGYFLYGSKDGSKNRKKVRGWMLKAKGEVLENIEKLKKIDEEDYNRVIDKVSAKYSKLKNLDSDEVYMLMDDMRKHWKRIQKDIEPKAKKTVKKIAKKSKTTARKAVNKAAKKVVKKTADKPKAKPKKKTATKK